LLRVIGILGSEVCILALRLAYSFQLKEIRAGIVISAHEALQLLREGNSRFVSGAARRAFPRSVQESIDKQAPFAVILGCSDSRVPVETVFDQGPGDLFVIRVAGNVVAPTQIGSVEFAATRFGTRLVVVLGHTWCGAVSAALEDRRESKQVRSPNLESILDRIRPSIEEVVKTEPADDRETLTRAVVRANVLCSTSNLRSGSRVLDKLAESEGLVFVGAEYSLENGRVDFFEAE
jgi:carbonic anhydrase